MNEITFHLSEETIEAVAKAIASELTTAIASAGTETDTAPAQKAKTAKAKTATKAKAKAKAKPADDLDEFGLDDDADAEPDEAEAGGDEFDEVEAAEDTAIDRETVRTWFKAYAAKDGRDAAIALLKKYGAEQMSDLDEKHFGTVIKVMKKAGVEVDGE